MAAMGKVKQTKYGPWLRDLFLRTGRRKKDLADAVFDGNQTIVSKILSDSRNVSAAEKDAILEFFDDGNSRKKVSASLLPVIGVVAAGVWREAEALAIAGEKTIPVVNSQGAGDAYALLVEGKSVNLVVPDGAYAVCVPYWKRRTFIQDGDLVHVERRRAGVIEATIKRVRRTGGKVELLPESSDPAFQSAISINETGDTDEVEIVGLVVGTYTQHESF